MLERIGHVLRMEDIRQVKALCLSWLKDLEGHDKLWGKKRKTILYWKLLLKEAGTDWTRIDVLTKDRKVCKEIVRERMKYPYICIKIHIHPHIKRQGSFENWIEIKNVYFKKYQNFAQHFMSYLECLSSCLPFLCSGIITPFLNSMISTNQKKG